MVERCTPLVWTVCQTFRLSRPDADDVDQSVWLWLVEHLPALSEPVALPGWLMTTARRKCLRVLRAAGQQERRERCVDLEKLQGGPHDPGCRAGRRFA